MALREVTNSELQDIAIAMQHIRNGRDILRNARAKKAADAVSKALKSVEGALRHAERANAAS